MNIKLYILTFRLSYSQSYKTNFSFLYIGQNDIKKLRRENEQLRREIWCLRDEYDKLEEILKKQKCQETSDEYEVSRLV